MRNSELNEEESWLQNEESLITEKDFINFKIVNLYTQRLKSNSWKSTYITGWEF